MFQHVEPFAGDPILSLNEDFQNDPRPHKINLSIGIYFDDAGRIPVLDSVRRAEAAGLRRSRARSPTCRSRAPRTSAARCRQLLFGAEHEAMRSGRVATIQSVGSSGGLKVGADFLARWFPRSEVWVSDPTWDNHRSMFEGAGLAVHTYPYYDAGDRRPGVRRDARDAAPRAGAERRAAARLLPQPDRRRPDPRPVGRADPAAAASARLIPYLDLAYQGFGDGIEDDAYAVRALARAPADGSPLSFFVANSFSKSMSVYGERCGALSVVCPDAAQAELVLGQLKFTVRRNYSSPPIHGGQIVATVLTEPALRSAWKAELEAMRERILAMRQALHAVLRGQAARPRLRLLPDAARHVQLHRPVAGAGRPAARAARGLPGALGAASAWPG